MKPKYTSRRTPGTGSLNGVIDQVGVGPFRRHRYDITAQMLDADGYKQAWGRKQWQACGAGIDGYERDKCATFVSFDWRMAPTDNATWVIHVIDLVRKFTGASRVDILAHSQGGLVAEAVLHDAASVGKIYRVATLGTPYLGAPKLFGELVFRNPCQFPIVLRKCLITPAALQRTIINMPGVMALLPDKAYFDLASLAPYVDKSHDAVPVSQSFEDYRAKISSELARLGRDLALIDGELNWHQSVDDWSTHPLLDDVVRVLRMVGYDASDPAKPCRKYRCPEEALGKYTPGRGTIAAIDLRGKLLDETERSTWGLVASGDGTVPLISAAEFNAASGKDLRGGAHDMYFCGVSHQGLAQSPRVWGVVQKFFGGFNYPEDAIEQRCPYGTSGTLEGAELNPGGPG